MIITEWENCYPSNWKGTIVPEAMAHPAKYSSKLIRRIYEHLQEQDWVKEGDRVLDPFGGVGLGSFDAMRLGLQWFGVELEEKFYNLGNQNIELWNSRYSQLPHWGSARLLAGDSRRLLEIVSGCVQVSLSSPPYADGSQHAGGDDLHPERMQGGAYYGVGISASVSSPPYEGTDVNYRKNSLAEDGKKYKRPYMTGQEDHYGATKGQLGGMKAEGFDAAISSPPFLQSEGGTPEPKPGGAIDERLYARHAAGNKSSHAYGESDGQLSDMKDGGFEAAVSSPPFTGTVLHDGGPALQQGGELHSDYGQTDGQLANLPADHFDASVSSPPYDQSNQNYKEGWKRFHDHHTPLHANDIQREAEYGTTEGQLSTSDDFWLAARAIVEQVYLALAPGGHAVWVTKRYVKGGKIVEFSQQWVQLCEAVGFKVVCWHHAMLVHKKGAQHTLDGGLIEKTTESKSFFRRLSEKRGSPRIDWEDVICMVKE